MIDHGAICTYSSRLEVQHLGKARLDLAYTDDSDSATRHVKRCRIGARCRKWATLRLFCGTTAGRLLNVQICRRDGDLHYTLLDNAHVQASRTDIL